LELRISRSHKYKTTNFRTALNAEQKFFKIFFAGAAAASS